MPMNVNFNWRVRPITSADAESNERAAGLASLGESIGKMVRARRGEQDRQRRIADEDAKKAAYADVAKIMQGRSDTLNRLMAERADLVQRIAQLRAEIGNG